MGWVCRDEADAKRKMRVQLDRKDELALQLLNLRAKHEKAAVERTHVRKRMFGALTVSQVTLHGLIDAVPQH